jgi:hypothetical protein
MGHGEADSCLKQVDGTLELVEHKLDQTIYNSPFKGSISLVHNNISLGVSLAPSSLYDVVGLALSRHPFSMALLPATSIYSIQWPLPKVP